MHAHEEAPQSWGENHPLGLVGANPNKARTGNTTVLKEARFKSPYYMITCI